MDSYFLYLFLTLLLQPKEFHTLRGRHASNIFCVQTSEKCLVNIVNTSWLGCHLHSFSDSSAWKAVQMRKDLLALKSTEAPEDLRGSLNTVCISLSIT